jgi:SNF2 family DNA or RNA helicase
MLRRLKREVAAELPPKTEVVLHCELSESEQALYDALYLSSRETIQKALEDRSGMLAVLEVLLRLRQVCAHPALIPDQLTPSSTKSELLLESLVSSKEAGHRSLVFSQWTGMLDLLEGPIAAAELSFLRLDGSTKDRHSIIEAFQAEDGPDLLLLSLKAGGVGITLTAADHVYLYDSWWNPAVEDQAADRAHRIGQENPVLVHRLIAKNTVEENVLKLQKKKRELAEALLSEGGAAGALTPEDLKILFADPEAVAC